MASRSQWSDIDRAVPLAIAFLVGIYVFAWVAGPILETQFGTEALLAVYGGVAVGAAGVTYALVRRLNARIGGETAIPPETEQDGTVIVRPDELDALDVDQEMQQLKIDHSSSGNEE